ncbi:beta-phosphoglucomutase family hydrolase [Kribbella capetownensis]|uniref:Beta-phosphoglucomutase n=1 Tax=Kribbella capetownensis TaxID=1572659 RepID=A0A4R0JHU3_9ACTN|nr:beta-phosphoglucomutase family hydrolase [Kribbella capetownensis]TCC44316.1 beta-phosphoglucomutase family hydrolase [Kribbella capetownensis]
MLGLPTGIRACLFDLDGVLTDTAAVHAAAWKEMFDKFLQAYADEHGQPFTPFDAREEYDAYVDGKPRVDGVRDFLTSRGISLPDGTPDDPPDAVTVNGLGNRKNEAVQRRIRTEGVHVFEGSRQYLKAVEAIGLRRAVVSSSANTREVLAVTELAQYVEEVVDGITIRTEGLRGKPAPDTFLAAAKRFGLDPSEAAVFEDALAGVSAGRSGHFGHVIGVDRVGQADQLKVHGADVVVRDLAELLEGR